MDLLCNLILGVAEVCEPQGLIVDELVEVPEGAPATGVMISEPTSPLMRISTILSIPVIIYVSKTLLTFPFLNNFTNHL